MIVANVPRHGDGVRLGGLVENNQMLPVFTHHQVRDTISGFIILYPVFFRRPSWPTRRSRAETRGDSWASSGAWTSPTV